MRGTSRPRETRRHAGRAKGLLVLAVVGVAALPAVPAASTDDAEVLDRAFTGDGVKRFPTEIDAIVPIGNGELLVARSGRPDSPAAHLHRVTAAGRPNLSFAGGDSRLSIGADWHTHVRDIIEHHTGFSVSIDATRARDGRVESRLAVMRLLLDGSLDRRFSGVGIAHFRVGRPGDALHAGELSVTDAGVISVLAASHARRSDVSQVWIMRFGLAGEPSAESPPSLGSGIVRLSGRTARFGSDGRVVVLGQRAAEHDYRLRRYATSGQLDRTFGNDGRMTVRCPGLGAKLEFHLDGRDRVVTFCDQPEEDRVIIARYRVDGALDATFAGRGIVRLSPTVDGRAGDFLSGAVGHPLGSGVVVIARAADDPQTLLVVLLRNSGTPNVLFSDDGRASLRLDGAVADPPPEAAIGYRSYVAGVSREAPRGLLAAFRQS